ncbi:Vi polysaccharide biosynthesis UDP-N-acetylglucosamine C-6 dehydrogenase TviB [Pseudoduganella sp. GCM10020061]|uniref:Vi polysaccharide biosynthesis UDP-N-acetylglucosamine C-6 dehydrogenase TviB n=1 Tax=Pseudoduganella sp. GCM10020061 TaxID=3317345 RepID=UPI00363D466F
MDIDNKKIAVVGLGYVGLPLAVEFGKRRPVVGFDIDHCRIEELRSGKDRTMEVALENIRAAEFLNFTCDARKLLECEIFIVTVPTPIDAANRPDLGPIIAASKVIGGVLKPGSVVIYESTVYPGCTEEVCVPILEKASGLVFNKGFFCGYSPERINPGDKVNTLTKIKKITSGSTPEAALAIDSLYGSIITAGTWRTSSIRVAEAAKVIENTQRDTNIALMNELSLLFHRLGIDTTEVLEAAGTKWNFLPFRPGLVGGHCIGVDPYYLTHKAQEVGYHPEVILAGRRVNDRVAQHVADETIKLLLKGGMPVLKSRVLVLGLAFKENCPDLRNTKVVDLVRYLQAYHCAVDIYDPWIDPEEALHEYKLQCLTDMPSCESYDAIILAVGHDEFRRMGAQGIKSFGKQNAILFDVKALLPAGSADGRL